MNSLFYFSFGFQSLLLYYKLLYQLIKYYLRSTKITQINHIIDKKKMLEELKSKNLISNFAS